MEGNLVWDILGNQTFLTIISGVLIFILGQLFIELYLKPLQRFKQLRAKAAYCLTFYANRFDLTTKISGNTSEELRKMAAELNSFAIEKPLLLFNISRRRLRNAASAFIGLSNSVAENPNHDFINESTNIVSKTLRLHMNRIRY